MNEQWLKCNFQKSIVLVFWENSEYSKLFHRHMPTHWKIRKIQRYHNLFGETALKVSQFYDGYSFNPHSQSDIFPVLPYIILTKRQFAINVRHYSYFSSNILFIRIMESTIVHNDFLLITLIQLGLQYLCKYDEKHISLGNGKIRIEIRKTDFFSRFFVHPFEKFRFNLNTIRHNR